MIKENKYRGKRLDNGEWVKGYYVKHGSRHWIYTGEVQYLVYPANADLPTKYEVDPETVCQYIGLEDKNDKEIYEKDIVGLYSEHRNEWDYGVVEYGEFNCSCCNGVYGWHFGKEDIRRNDEYAVKGNIFDNPELLKEDSQNANHAN